MKDIFPKCQANSAGLFSIAGAIIFAVVAFFAYQVWTKGRTDDCLDAADKLYREDWATACKRNAKTAKELIAMCKNDTSMTARDCNTVKTLLGMKGLKNDADTECDLPTTVVWYCFSNQVAALPKPI